MANRLIVLAICLVTSSTMTQAAPTRTVLNFDADWKFSLTDPANGMMPKLDDSAWRSLDVPHDWSIEGPFGPQYGSGNGYAPGGIGWYRKHFRVDGAEGKRVTIQFDGVYDHSLVWVNGQLVGGRPYGYISFECDLTPYINPKGENLVAVRVDHSRYADSRWYTGSGIYRHVHLTLTDLLHIGQWGTYVTTSTSNRAHIETEVVNDAQQAATYELQTDILSPEGAVVASHSTTSNLKAGKARSAACDLNVPNAKQWTPDDPTLYTIRTRLIANGVCIDETQTLFGFRTARFDPNHGFSLNGKAMKIKGVCLHHDAGSLGAAVPEAVLERRLRALKEIGVNAIRTSHNPPAPELLDLCDRLGFLVKDEAFDEFTPSKNKWVVGWNAGEPSRFGYGESFAEWAVRDIQDMVRRDRNHPSIILWSIGNEIDFANDPFAPRSKGQLSGSQPDAKNMAKLGKPLVAAIKKLDKTRPVTAALAAVAISDPAGFSSILDVVGYNYQESRYAADHKAHPNRVIFGSENSHRYEDWLAVRDNEFISGQFLWTGADYLGEAYAWPVRGAGSGLLDLCSFKKPLGWFRQSLWSDKPMVYICTSENTPEGRRPHVSERWNWSEGENIVVSCYSNCPEVTLFLNGRTLGSRTTADANGGVRSWTVPFESGELKAVGSKDGKQLCEFALRTAGEPDRVELVADTSGHVEYRIVDANGVIVPTATNRVRIELTGPATILGIGNGDLSDSEDVHGPDHRAYQGRGLVILRRTGPGTISVRATSPGLKDGVAAQ